MSPPPDRAAPGTRGNAARSVAIVGGLYLLALGIRLVAIGELPFPVFEPSAYYAAVAENLVQGKGLVSDAVWSYATSPLVVPKPAFELWLPMSSLVSALAMAILGPSYWAAQVSGALLGALLAPLAWAIGREGARTAQLDSRRGGAVAIASGLIAAILAPLVLGSVVPDSYTPFTVFVLVAAVLVPTVLGVRGGADEGPPARPRVLAGLTLGSALGLAYLSRQEVVWLGLTFLLMLAWVSRSRPAAGRLRDGLARLWPVVVGGLVMVVPWLMRNAATFGSAFPGQAVENMFLLRNEDVFAFLERPSAAGYLGQDIADILWNPVAAAWDGFVNVLVLPAFPIGVAGLIALVGLRRSALLRRPTALLALLISGSLTFAGTMLLFPVATRWGTFLHASGPLLVALVVVAALGADAVMARMSRLRRWQRPNVVIGPLALVSVTAVLAFLQLGLLADQSSRKQARYEALAESIVAVAESHGVELPDTLITDHPMWLAEATGGYAVALPDEDLSSIMALSQHFAAPWVVVIDERGRYPDALLEGSARSCLDEDPVELLSDTGSAWLFRLADGCSDTTTGGRERAAPAPILGATSRP